MVHLHIVASISLAVGIISAIVITGDILAGNKQQMMIMNFVYPITALYSGPLALIFYYSVGRYHATKEKMDMKGMHQMHKKQIPFWQSVVKSALHCGSGCTLGDVMAEIFLLFFPIVILNSSLLGKWTLDFVFAFIIGIIFQYYSIKPMRKISPINALWAALKADSLSLTFWQMGMYGWMAIALFLIFKHPLATGNPVFWFMMQIAMIAGFITSYPINWLLLKKGIKEVM